MRERPILFKGALPFFRSGRLYPTWKRWGLSGNERAIRTNACHMPQQLAGESYRFIAGLLTIGHGRNDVELPHPVFPAHFYQSIETRAIGPLPASDEQDMAALVGSPVEHLSYLRSGHFYTSSPGVLQCPWHCLSVPEADISPDRTLNPNDLDRPALGVLIDANPCDVAVLVNDKDLGMKFLSHVMRPPLIERAYHQRSRALGGQLPRLAVPASLADPVGGSAAVAA